MKGPEKLYSKDKGLKKNLTIESESIDKTEKTTNESIDLSKRFAQSENKETEPRKKSPPRISPAPKVFPNLIKPINERAWEDNSKSSTNQNTSQDVSSVSQQPLKTLSNSPRLTNLSPKQTEKAEFNQKQIPAAKPKLIKRRHSKSIGGEPKKPVEEVKINWEKDMEKLTKEEMSIKKSLNQLDMKFKAIKSKSTKSQSPLKLGKEDKEQKEIQKSLLQIDALLKRISNKYKEKPKKVSPSRILRKV